MSREALSLIEVCLDRKDPFLDIGNCGLTDSDFVEGSDIDKSLRKCSHIYSLILSNEWWDYSSSEFVRSQNKGSGNVLNSLPLAISFLPKLCSLLCNGSKNLPWGIYNTNAFAPLTNLVYLDLSYNSIKFLNPFFYLRKLTDLNLSYNNISSCKGLDKLFQLKNLDLSNNYIDELNWLKDLKNLVRLNLSKNQITSIQELQNFPFLEELLISKNRIRKIEGLQKMAKLEILDLSNNNIQILENLNSLASLKTFRASHNGIKTLTGLNKLNELRYLNLSNNFIEIIAGLEQLTNLKTLNLSNNKIGQIKGLNNLLNLTKLLLFSNRIRRIERLNALKALQVLHVGNNRIRELGGLSELSFLHELNASFNIILKLKNVTEIVSLQNLNLKKNYIADFEDAQHNSSIKKLDISYNNISNTDGIEKLTSLENLDISVNFIEDILSIGKLANLKIIKANYNKIKVLPEFSASKKIQEVVFSNNLIEEIYTLAQSLSLQKIDLCNNEIESIEGLNQLTDIKSLNLSHNKIHDITCLEKLPCLVDLDLNKNKITEIRSLTRLTSLKKLNIAFNRIIDISGLGELVNLDILDISYNRIADIKPLLPLLKLPSNPMKVILESFEDQFGDYYQSQFSSGYINVMSNSLISPPVEFVIHGNKAILDWFIAGSQGAIINMEAKCILFGNGETGKTTLLHQLINNEFLEENNRTHGIIIKQWIISRDSVPNNIWEKVFKTIQKYEIENPNSPFLDTPNKLILNMWDFGGQEYYHATHRLFMNNNVLYLLIWDEKSNNQDELKGNYPVSYWIDNINHFSKNNTTLNIQNKVIDVCQQIDKKLFFKVDFRNSKETKSVKRYSDDIEDLTTGILNQISSLSYVAEPFPKVYSDISQAIRNDTRKYLTYDQYIKICNQNDETIEKIMSESSQIETLAKFLDTTGIIVCFRFRDNITSEKLTNLIFINPQWLTGIVYAILEKGKSEFDKEHVQNIASAYQLDAEIWIDIMKEFELIFEIKKKNQLLYIAPQYLPEICQNPEAFDIALDGKNMQHCFTLSYPNFLPKSNFLRFIAKYGCQSKNYLYWKNGIVFIKEKTVFVECLTNNDERKIIVRVEDKHAGLVTEIYETLLNIDLAEDIEVSVNQIDFVEVKKLNEKINNKNIEIDSTVGKTVHVNNFSFLFRPDTSHSNVDISIKIPKKVFISYSKKDINYVTALKKHLAILQRQDLITTWQDTDILPGSEWHVNIQNQLNESDIILFLVSSDFIATDYIWKIEVPKALERHKKNEAIVIPIILRSCLWETASFGSIQALPLKGKPINKFTRKDDAYTQIATGIQKLLDKID